MASDDKELSKGELLDKLSSLKARARSARQRAEDTSEELMDAGVSAAAAFAVGMYKARAQRLNQAVQIAGMDPALVLGAVATIAGRNMAGNSGRLVKGAGRGLLDTVAYEAGVARGRTA